MSEADEQKAVIEWCELAGYGRVFHVPNGGFRRKPEAARLKAMGVRAGVPDLFVPYPRGGYHGLFVEMKDGRGRLSAAQEDWLGWLDSQGYACRVGRGAGKAVETIRAYMALGEGR